MYEFLVILGAITSFINLTAISCIHYNLANGYYPYVLR